MPLPASALGVGKAKFIRSPRTPRSGPLRRSARCCCLEKPKDQRPHSAPAAGARQREHMGLPPRSRTASRPKVPLAPRKPQATDKATQRRTEKDGGVANPDNVATAHCVVTTPASAPQPQFEGSVAKLNGAVDEVAARVSAQCVACPQASADIGVETSVATPSGDATAECVASTPTSAPQPQFEGPVAKLNGAVDEVAARVSAQCVARPLASADLGVETSVAKPSGDATAECVAPMPTSAPQPQLEGPMAKLNGAVDEVAARVSFGCAACPQASAHRLGVETSVAKPGGDAARLVASAIADCPVLAWNCVAQPRVEASSATLGGDFAEAVAHAAAVSVAPMQVSAVQIQVEKPAATLAATAAEAVVCVSARNPPSTSASAPQVRVEESAAESLPVAAEADACATGECAVSTGRVPWTASISPVSDEQATLLGLNCPEQESRPAAVLVPTEVDAAVESQRLQTVGAGTRADDEQARVCQPATTPEEERCHSVVAEVSPRDATRNPCNDFQRLAETEDGKFVHHPQFREFWASPKPFSTLYQALVREQTQRAEAEAALEHQRFVAAQAAEREQLCRAEAARVADRERERAAEAERALDREKLKSAKFQAMLREVAPLVAELETAMAGEPTSPQDECDTAAGSRRPRNSAALLAQLAKILQRSPNGGEGQPDFRFSCVQGVTEADDDTSSNSPTKGSSDATGAETQSPTSSGAPSRVSSNDELAIMPAACSPGRAAKPPVESRQHIGADSDTSDCTSSHSCESVPKPPSACEFHQIHSDDEDFATDTDTDEDEVLTFLAHLRPVSPCLPAAPSNPSIDTRRRCREQTATTAKEIAIQRRAW